MKRIGTLLAAIAMANVICAETVSAQWTFSNGKSGQKAVVSAEGIFSTNLVKVNGLKYSGAQAVGSATLTKLQPVQEVSSPGEKGSVDFILIPCNGVSFTPTKVSFDCARYGTNGGNIDYAVAAGDEVPVILEKGIKPNRNNTGEVTSCQSSVSGITATNSTPLHLKIYIYNLGASKQIGLSNICIGGDVSGTAVEDTYCNFTLKISPEGAATVTQSPEGARFVQYTPLSLGMKINEGFRFIDWQDGHGTTLSTLKSFDFSIVGDTTIVVNCRQLPVMDRGCYDFIVPDDGTVKDALEMANNRTDATRRYRIFIRPGNHQMPASQTTTSLGNDGVEYPSPNNYVEQSNISFIGLDYKTTSFRNTLPQVYVDSKYGLQHPLEGNNPDALTINKGVTGTYFQGVTVKSDMKDATGRNAALKDYGDKTVFKDAALWGYQDTYVSNNSGGRFYFEGGLLRGRTDFLCGSGDVFYNGVELLMCAAGGKVTAPSNKKEYGYVFRNCKITGPADVNGKYTLGRPWGKGTPAAIYIDTEMEVIPSSLGWDEMGDGYPSRFAEYNSHHPDGSVVSLTGRKKTFLTTHTNNPVLTDEEAATYTIEAVMGSTDGWDPTLLTMQVKAPENVRLNGTTLSWDAAEGAIGYVVCAADTAVAFTCQTTCTVPDANGTYTVRSANEMGGLGEPSQSVSTSINPIVALPTTEQKVYSIGGTDVTGKTLHRGIYIVGRKKVVWGN
ncbi:MAG: hypothetical protein J6K05_09350 [Bacteroidaceae bacterium]|nr:hypothetical protein [Bacteroidaceae bacterium]